MIFRLVAEKVWERQDNGDLMFLSFWGFLSKRGESESDPFHFIDGLFLPGCRLSVPVKPKSKERNSEERASGLSTSASTQLFEMFSSEKLLRI